MGNIHLDHDMNRFIEENTMTEAEFLEMQKQLSVASKEQKKKQEATEE